MKTLFTTIMVCIIVGLAAFGAWTLYNQTESQIKNSTERMTNRVDRVRQALEE